MRRRSRTSSTTEAHSGIPLADFERGESVRPRPHLNEVSGYGPKEYHRTYRSMVISRTPKHSAISSYSPMRCRTHPSPRKTMSGAPLGLPRSERLTVKGASLDAWGLRLNLRRVVRRLERRYCAIVWEGELIGAFVRLERSNGGNVCWSEMVE